MVGPKMLRALVAGAALVASGASALGGQIVMYSTTGTFSGGTGATVCTATQCTVDGFTLSFANAPSTNYFAPTLVDLGQFVTAFSPTGGTSGFTAFTGVNFTLTILQTVPGAGSSALADGITGSLAYNPSASTLVWTPVVTSTTIGFVTYRLVTDNNGAINIQAPTTLDNPNPTSVKANVNVAPEPATLLLLAPGLVGLGFAVRARRSSSRKI